MDVHETFGPMWPNDGGGIEFVVEASGPPLWMCEHSHHVIDDQFCSEMSMGYLLF